MPIKRLQKREAQFPNIGKLRKGAKKPASGNAPGKDLTYFRFDTEDAHAQKLFEVAYGTEPTQIEIVLPFDTVDENFTCWQEKYGSGGLKHRCDGETCVLWYDEKAGMYKRDAKPCPGQCKEVGRLRLIIPVLQRFAYVTAETHSVHDIVRLTQQLTAVQAMAGSLKNIPFILSRTPCDISAPGDDGKRARRTSYLLSIEVAPEWAAHRLSAARQNAISLDAEVQEDRLLEAQGDVVIDTPVKALPAPEPVEKISDIQKRTIHALGMAYSNSRAEWDDLRHDQVQTAFNTQSLNDITVAQADRYTIALEKKCRDECYNRLTELGYNDAQETVIVHRHAPNLVQVSELVGVPLSNVLKELKEEIASFSSLDEVDETTPF